MNLTSSSLTFLLLLFLLLIISPVHAASPNAYEPDNSYSEARSITAGLSGHRSIVPANDQDWVKFILTATENIELTTIQGLDSPDMRVTLYDHNILPLAVESGCCNRNPPVIRMDGLSPGTYYALFEDDPDYYDVREDEILDYVISLKTTVGSGDSYEPDNRWEDAVTIIADSDSHRTIIPANDQDWVKFTLTATENIELTTKQGLDSPDMKITLYDNYQNILAYDSGCCNRNPPVIRMDGLSPGTYYALFEDDPDYYDVREDEISDYVISLKTTVGSGDSYEPDNRWEDATIIFSGISSHHTIVPANDQDWVKFTLTAIDNIELTTTQGLDSPDMKITLYDNYQNILAYDSGCCNRDSPVIRMDGLSPGTYYALFEDNPHYNVKDDEVADYSIWLSGAHVAKPPGKPARPYASDGNFSNKVKVTWNNHSGIRYKVYRCRNTSTTSCTKISYTTSPFSDYHTVPNVVYYYRIKACNSIGCSAFSSYDSGYRKTPKLPALMTIIQYILNH